MEELINSLLQLLIAVLSVLVSFGAILLPWTPLVAWIVFWLFGVNWLKLREVILQGGWLGVLLIGLMIVLIWGLIAPPPGGIHQMFGLTLSNFVGKTVYMTELFCIMFLCGSVQLSGCCDQLCKFDQQYLEVESQPEHH